MFSNGSIHRAWQRRAFFASVVALAVVVTACDVPNPTGPDVPETIQAKNGDGGGPPEGRGGGPPALKGGGPPDGEGGGPPDGEGGGPPDGNGGGPPAGSGTMKGDVYADLVYLLRNADGLPLLRNVGGEMCLQPVSYTPIPGVAAVTNEANGEQVWPAPLMGDMAVVAADDEGEVEACDVQADYLIYVHEVDIGRLNLGRAPAQTTDRALDEVLLKLDAASSILLDHAGRLAPDGIPIDAPGENLAIYSEFVLYGTLGNYVLPAGDHSASALAGAADKYGTLDLDLVVYLNRILDFPDNVSGGMGTLIGDGTVGVLGEKYLDYGGYGYSRSQTFPGCVVGYRLVGVDLVAFEGRIMDEVFGGQAFTGSNVHGFAQRADDARAVILFEHDNVITAIDRIGESVICSSFSIP